jgi:hypothetical protein
LPGETFGELNVKRSGTSSGLLHQERVTELESKTVPDINAQI